MHSRRHDNVGVLRLIPPKLVSQNIDIVVARFQRAYRLALGLALLLPAPLGREHSQDDGLGRSDRRDSASLGIGVVERGVEEPRQHVDTPRLDLGHRRVFLDVDKVDRGNLLGFMEKEDEDDGSFLGVKEPRERSEPTEFMSSTASCSM